jgi:superfamily I DNA/RNA helicase
VGVKAAFIDEAQDLTALQWEVCRTAFSKCEKVFISGDDLQTLFCHSGALPQVLINFSKRYPTVKLEKSYRLSREVYRFARNIVGFIGEKVDKDFEPVKDVEGFVNDITDRNELYNRIFDDYRKNGKKFIPGRWYFLFRNNLFISTVADELEKRTIPYHTSSGFVIPRQDLARIRRYYNYRRQGFGSPEAFKRFCEEYKIRDINSVFTESELIPSERRYTYMNYIDNHTLEKLEEMAEQEPFLLLSTIHRVKGGEADYTAVFLDCTRKVAGNQFQNADEELRVLYVACTRARTGLYLVRSSGDSRGLDRVVEVIRSLTT